MRFLQDGGGKENFPPASRSATRDIVSQYCTVSGVMWRLQKDSSSAPPQKPASFSSSSSTGGRTAVSTHKHLPNGLCAARHFHAQRQLDGVSHLHLQEPPIRRCLPHVRSTDQGAQSASCRVSLTRWHWQREKFTLQEAEVMIESLVKSLPGKAFPEVIYLPDSEFLTSFPVCRADFQGGERAYAARVRGGARSAHQGGHSSASESWPSSAIREQAPWSRTRWRRTEAGPRWR
jgi:hypothetical protein